MSHKEQVAAICGLFCGACPYFPLQCQGCHSDKKAPCCAGCPEGFHACAQEHGADRCYQCADFPCHRLEDFLHKHCTKGLQHGSMIIDNLKRMQAVGVDRWVDEQLHKSRCPQCGSIQHWNSGQCDCKSSGPGIVKRLQTEATKPPTK